ncbi:hypothetical protein PR048_006139 [Dryococelus australis]|uniref:Uncharacterized protein n=1 Tax=Dryococelus australis TaxID=614101 RepID=A0ABQ9IB42_9NEOP|nr:hypothetical protein PR048_006139 [Dryococelus australis]
MAAHSISEQNHAYSTTTYGHLRKNKKKCATGGGLVGPTKRGNGSTNSNDGNKQLLHDALILNLMRIISRKTFRSYQLFPCEFDLWARSSRGRGAVAERLDYSPPTKANRVQSSAGSLPDFRKWESCRTIPLVGGFSRGSPVSSRPCIPALVHSRLIPPSSALKISLLRTAQVSRLNSTPSSRDIPCVAS